MSTPPSAPSPPRSKPRKKPSADVVSFEELIAAHHTEREPGQLPREGVVLIGVDHELQRRMKESLPAVSDPRAGDSPANATGEPNFGAPKKSALILKPLPNASAEIGARADAINFGAPIIGASNFAPPKAGAPKFCAAEFSAPTLGAPKLMDPSADDLRKADQHPATSPLPALDSPDVLLDEEAVDVDVADFNLRNLLVRRSGTKTYSIHAVSRIQDVLTAAERDLLRWLWERGRPVPHTESVRVVTGPNGEGARRLAAQAGLIYNTFKNLTRALSTKFALDIVKPERNLPTVYAVYHYSAILQRQRQAGFTGVVHKNGGGRELVNTQAQPAPTRPDLRIEQLERILGALKFSAPKFENGAPNYRAGLNKSGAPNFGPPIRNKKSTSEKESTSTPSTTNLGAPTFVVNALFDRTHRTDVEAARLITKGCLEANPTVQPEEIARLIRTADIPRTITNPVGLLIRMLPSRCTAASLEKYREHWAQQDVEEKRRRAQEHAENLQTARGILESVARGEQWDPATVEWAKGILPEGG